MPLEALAPLLAIGVEWISLAKDAPAIGLVVLDLDLVISDGLADCTDWLDTANVVLGLDLVISVDTAIAHLAGGLGVPCWILLAAVPDMRWMLNRSDTPWYHSVRLYRQRIAGEWGPVVEDVARDLNELVRARAKEAA